MLSIIFKRNDSNPSYKNLFILRTILPKGLGLSKVKLLKHRKKGLSCVLVMNIKKSSK